MLGMIDHARVQNDLIFRLRILGDIRTAGTVPCKRSVIKMEISVIKAAVRLIALRRIILKANDIVIVCLNFLAVLIQE